MFGKYSFCVEVGTTKNDQSSIYFSDQNTSFDRPDFQGKELNSALVLFYHPGNNRLIERENICDIRFVLVIHERYRMIY